MNILKRKIELWLVLALAFFGALLWGGAVWYAAKGGRGLGPAGSAIGHVFTAPQTLAELVRHIRDPVADLAATEQRFEGQAGFSFSYPPGTRPDAPYLMLNRYDGDLGRSVSELVDLDSQEVLHRWVFDVDPLWAEVLEDGTPSEFRMLTTNFNSARFRNVHAMPDPDGSVVTQGMGTPLIKLGPDGRPVWTLARDAYHHAIERDAEGAYWVASRMEPVVGDVGSGWFRDHGLARISPEGKLLWEKSVARIFEENGLGPLLYGQGRPDDDPVHLNDIQPVLEDGTLWRQGDLLLSLRNRSMVVLYRPATNRILWYRTGPWLHQHDVNILGDGRISVFDNAAWPGTGEEWASRGPNGLHVVDLATDTVTAHAPETFAALDLRTPTQGRGRILADGGLFVEESMHGRLVATAPDGHVDWSYVNRAGNDGRVFILNWSRLVDRTTGDALRARLAQQPG